MTDHEILLKLIVDLKRENETLNQQIDVERYNYNKLRDAYNELLQEEE